MDNIIFFILIIFGTYFTLKTWLAYGSLAGFLSHLWQQYTNTEMIIKLIIIALCFLYIYYFLYKRKPKGKNKKTLKNFTIYFSAIFTTYYALKIFNRPIFNDIFNNPLLVSVSQRLHVNTLLAYASSLTLLISFGLFIINRIMKPKGPKGLRHGPRFTTKAREQDGIVIGTYDMDVLPKHIRTFTRATHANIIIPYDRLSRGVTILGSMGCGKSRLMRAIHDKITEKYPNIPILVNDPKGEWLRTYYNPETDLIFAPNDTRTCGWKIWDDFRQRPELHHSMITTAVQSHSSPTSEDRFWTDSAIALLKDITTQTTPEEARDILLSKREAKSDDRTFMSIYSTAMLGFRDIITTELGARKAAKSYSIQELLNWKGRIFLLNNPSCADEQKGALTLMLSAFLMEAISKADVMADNSGHVVKNSSGHVKDSNPIPTTHYPIRASAFIDEALSFHLPPEVERAIYTQSRSKGLCIIAGAQRLPDPRQGEKGEWSAQAGHMFGMRIGDLASRKVLSERLGKIIYDEEQKSSTEGKGGTSKTKTTTRREHAAIEPSDFGALRNREFVLFHEEGVAVGKTVDVEGEQKNIEVLQYDPRQDVHEFLRSLL